MQFSLCYSVCLHFVIDIRLQGTKKKNSIAWSKSNNNQAINFKRRLLIGFCGLISKPWSM